MIYDNIIVAVVSRKTKDTIYGKKARYDIISYTPGHPYTKVSPRTIIIARVYRSKSRVHK